MPACLPSTLVASVLHWTSPKTEVKHIPKRLHPVLPIDLLAFGVGPPVIADAKLVDAQLAMTRDFRTELHLDAEVIGCQAQRSRNLCRHHLIARFDVGEGLVKYNIKQKGNQTIGKIMMK